MNGKQLKNSILQWAIQGKLVPQDPNDEPASVLLERIRLEKERLVKEKKIKRDKNESIIYRGADNSHYEKILATGEVKCIDNEIPFEIPQGWEWVRIQEVIALINGRAYKKEELLSNGKYKVLRVGNFFTNDSWYFSNLELPDDKYCYYGDLLYAWSASFGPKIWKGDKTIFHYHIWNVKYNRKILLREYLYYFLLADKIRISNSTTGSTMIHVSMENMKSRLIPIPPIIEQQRIVEKIETLLPFIEKYNHAQTELDQLTVGIYPLLKKSILQEAIQGKLVPQDPTDEPVDKLLERIRNEKRTLVKQGKLKAKDITDSTIFRGANNKYYEKIGEKVNDITEEIPFDIPESWAWCRIKDCCIRIFSGKSPKYSKTPTAYIIIGQQANQWEHIKMQYVKYGTEEYARHIDTFQYLLDGDVLLNTLGNGTLGRCGIFENISERVLTDGHLFVFRTIEKSIAKYILYYLTLNYTEINKNADGSTNQTFLNLKKVSNYLIPLPPLKEIERIVSKKEELYSKL